MKFELTNPTAWKAVSERNIPMAHKIKVYEKLGGAYRMGENGGEQVYNNIAELLKSKLNEGDGSDHEVGMALNLLDDVIKNANELKGKIGTQETNLAGWIQDHISQAQNFINQANTGFHKLDNSELSEGIKAFDERYYGKKGLIIMIDDNGKKLSAVFKDKKNADKYNRNNPEDLKKLAQLAQKAGFGNTIDEGSKQINENFPNMKKWWEEDKNDLMSFVYFLQRQIPPTGKEKYEKAWKDLVVQLQKRTPAPKNIYDKLLAEPINEISYTSTGDLKIKKQYKSLDDYEDNAKVGDYVWIGRNADDFKGISKNLLSKVVGKNSDGVILTPYGKNKKYTVPQKNQIVIVVESLLKEDARIVLVNPNTNKFVKTIMYSGPNRDVDKEIEKLNKKLPSSQKEKGFYWTVSSFESIKEGASKAELDKVRQAVEAASSFMNVGSELKKLGIRYVFATEPLPIYIVQQTPNNRIAIVNKRYATKPDFVVGDIAVGVMD